MNKIHKFLERYNVTNEHAARILRVTRENFYAWKSGRRKLPPYIEGSIDLHLDISAAHVKRRKELAKK